MTDIQSASHFWCQTPFYDPRPDFCYCHTISVLLMWGALCDERTGLSFVAVITLYVICMQSFCFMSFNTIQSRVKVMLRPTVYRPVCFMSGLIWAKNPDFFLLSDSYTSLLMWGALSQERTGLSFSTDAGPSQRSHSRAQVPRYS
jgi:hypothetical protein